VLLNTYAAAGMRSLGVTNPKVLSSTLAMQEISASEIVTRAAELLWVIARCDVENLSANRDLALDRLHDLEIAAAGLNIDLYRAILAL
jgi:hypothetical protein